MSTLAGSAGLPAYLKGNAQLLVDDRGVRGGEARSRASLLAKDFVFDVVFSFPKGQEGEFFSGIGENVHQGDRVENTVCIRAVSPANRWAAGEVSLIISGQPPAPLGKVGDNPGPHALRVEKKGTTLTFSVCVGYDGTFKPAFAKTLPDLAAAAAFLNGVNSSLFFSGTACTEAVVLSIDGKPADPGPAAGAPASGAAEGKPIPFFNLAGDAGLPAYLTANAETLADAGGIRSGQMRTVAKDLVDHDFRFDVEFQFEQAGNHSVVYVGIGENGRDGNWITNSVVGASYAPGEDQLSGSTTLLVSKQEQVPIGRYAGELGPHLIRLEKRGKTLTLALCVNYADHFETTSSRTIPDLSVAAPFLNKNNSALFVQTNAIVKAVRLSIDGKPAAAAAGPGHVATGKSSPPGTPTPAAASSKEPPLFWLAGAAGLPPYLRATPATLADGDGLRMGELRTVQRDLIDHDFTFDVVYQFADAAEGHAEVVVGMGEGTWDGNRLVNSVTTRIGSPPTDQNAILATSKQPESNLGKVGKSAGPHMLRMQKRAGTLTIAVCPDFDGKFDPTIFKVMADLQSAAPFLKSKNSGLFLLGENWICKSVRLTVDGKSAGGGNALGSSLELMHGPADPQFLVKMTRASFPSTLEKDKAFVFEAESGLVLKDTVVRTHASDYVSKDFTFDIVYRVTPEGGKEVHVGIGENKWEGNRANNSVLARLSSGVSDGISMLAISNSEEVKIGNVGKDAGPHLCRVRKVGQTLTFAVWANVDLTKPLGDPDGVKVIPDLKTAAPYLTAKNSKLFFAGDGAIEKIRLIVGGEATVGGELELSIPPRIVEGKPLRQRIIKPADAALAKGKQFSVETGPAGLTISPTGDFAWTPTHEQVGRHDVKVKIQGPKDVSVLATASIEVVSADDAKAVKGDLTKVDALYRLVLIDGNYHLTSGAGDLSMLLLEGAQLRRLELDGFTVRETLKLPKSYTRIGERAAYFVAMSDEGKCLDLIDKKSLKITRSIPLDYRTRFDLALNPRKPVSYVTVEKPTGDGLRSDILTVEESTGTVREPDDFIGRYIKVSPSGTRLYAAYTEVYEKGSHLLINPDRIHIIPDYGSIDLLIVYDVTAVLPRTLTVKEKAGANSTGLELSRDGQRLSYLSHGGYPIYSYNPAAWDPFDLSKRPVSFAAKDHGGDATKLAFHPVLDIVVLPGKDGPVAFNRETGQVEPDRIELKSSPLPDGTKVRDARFSLDGMNVILDCEDPDTKEICLRKVKLRLSAEELGKIKAFKPDADVPPADLKPITPGAGPNRA